MKLPILFVFAFFLFSCNQQPSMPITVKIVSVKQFWGGGYQSVLEDQVTKERFIVNENLGNEGDIFAYTK